MNRAYLKQLKPGELITGHDISYAGTLRRIKKSKDPYQAIWEAVMNSLEAIRDKSESSEEDYIDIRFYYKKDLLEKPEFDRLEIEDTGIGFNDENFARFLKINDDSKGRKNRGSGRIQLLHLFGDAHYRSIYLDKEVYQERTFEFSSSEVFIDKNAIVRYGNTIVTSDKHIHTILTCRNISDIGKNDFCYEKIAHDKFKEQLKEHYLPYFCAFKHEIPLIKIHIFFDKEEEVTELSKDDFPVADKHVTVNIHYSQYDQQSQEVKKLDETELFDIRCFKLPKNQLEKNKMAIVCKEEVVSNINVKFNLINDNESLDGHRFLAFISSDYLDNLVGETRGELTIPEEKDIKHDGLLINDKVIVIEDITSHANDELRQQYPELEQKQLENQDNLDRLADMFLLNKDTVHALCKKHGTNMTPEFLLRKTYEDEVGRAAKSDVKIQGIMDHLDSLDPTADDYEKEINDLSDQFSRLVPKSNRNNIIRYIARRKLVLEFFDKTLERKLEIQKKSSRNIDEKLLHNILFKQTSKNPEVSDLWLLNEEFIYFKGNSEIKLKDVEIGGQKLFKEEISEEEEKFLYASNENRTIKRPDILLFPEEGKCIIIELKNPDVNIADHLTQINNYATLILQFSSDKFPIKMFYGYLIGENITSREVRAHDADFKEACKFDYLFRPHKTIAGEVESKDGSLYTEVIKYSTLLKRAKMRNKIFIDKLDPNQN